MDNWYEELIYLLWKHQTKYVEDAVAKYFQIESYDFHITLKVYPRTKHPKGVIFKEYDLVTGEEIDVKDMTYREAFIELNSMLNEFDKGGTWENESNILS